MNICFRVDSSVLIGYGHLSRCIRLADELSNRGHNCFFIKISNNKSSNLSLKSYKIFYLDEYILQYSIYDDSLLTLLINGLPDLVISDSYEFDEDWEKNISSKTKLLVLYDLADRAHCCHGLIDMSFGRNASDYSLLVGMQTILYVGGKYSILNPDFNKFSSRTIRFENCIRPSTVLISYGAMDVKSLTLPVINALRYLFGNELDICIMASSQSSIRDDLLSSDISSLNINLCLDVDDVPSLMSKTDIGFICGGLTSYELAVMKIPMIISPISPIQLKSSTYISNNNISKILDYELILSNSTHSLASKISNLLSELYKLKMFADYSIVDGKGVFRCADIAEMILSSSGNS